MSWRKYRPWRCETCTHIRCDPARARALFCVRRPWCSNLAQFPFQDTECPDYQRVNQHAQLVGILRYYQVHCGEHGVVTEAFSPEMGDTAVRPD